MNKSKIKPLMRNLRRNRQKLSPNLDNKVDRVTNKTIKQHREQILEQAKKFKYPLQYERHKLIINTIIIALVFVISFCSVAYWQLYKSNNTSNFLFKLTQAIPLPIAKVDDNIVLYSDYLAYYRSSIHYYKNKQLKSNPNDDLELIKNEYRLKSFENAIKITYAQKIAKQNNIKVTQEEIDQELADKMVYMDGVLSKEAFDNIIRDYYGLTKYEYQKIFIRYPILLKKVSLFVDHQARENVDQINQMVKKAEFSFEQIAEKMSGKVDFIDSGIIKRYNNDGGITKEALKLDINQVSEPIISRSLNGYYIVKLISKDQESLRYYALRVPLNEFNNQINRKLDQKQYQSYIELDQK